MTTVVILLLASVLAACSRAPEFDVVIVHGTVYDGSGTSDGVRQADVGISGDRITAIGDLEGRTARQIIDASGRAVAPGFINAYSHAGATLLADGDGDSDLRQGVTTEILVDSPVDWTAATAPADQQAMLARFGITVRPNDPAAYVDQLLSRGTSMNIGMLASAEATGAPPAGETAIHQRMQAGALGMSIDLSRSPGLAVDQLTTLAGVVARDGGVFLANIGDGVPLDRGVSELVSIATSARVPFVVAALDRSASRQPGGMASSLAPFRDAGARQLTVAVTINGFVDNAADRKIIVDWTVAMVGTASPSLRPDGALTSLPHDAAAFGAFAHFLGAYTRDEHLVDLREAIRRLTGLPSAVYHLSRRGFIRENNFADVVVFDPMTIDARATAAKPDQYPVGIDYVIVNGVVAVTPKGPSGVHPGRFLAGPAARPPT